MSSCFIQLLMIMMSSVFHVKSKAVCGIAAIVNAVFLTIFLACYVVQWNYQVSDSSLCHWPTPQTKTHFQIYLKQEILDDRKKPLSAKITKKYYNHQGQPDVILVYFKEKKNGTFLEAGGNDGFHHANSLPLEMEHGWRGLLVEPVPHNYDSMIKSGRSTMFLKACISPKPYPYTTTMKVASPGHGYEGFAHLADRSLVYPSFQLKITHQMEMSVECYPLYDIMMAVGMNKLDALMLDVQGPELAILKTIPWDCVDIELILVENNYVYTGQREAETDLFEETMAYLKPHGYTFLKQVYFDYIFVKNSTGRTI